MHSKEVPVEMIKEDKKPVKRSNRVALCYHASYIIMGLIVMGIAIWAYKSLSTYDESITDFKDNWFTLPIVDIRTAPSNCPPDYENLIKREWPGTVTGCDCTESNYYYEKLSEGE